MYSFITSAIAGFHVIVIFITDSIDGSNSEGGIHINIFIKKQPAEWITQ